ncbi:hypothetical protein AB0L33_29195 [Streptomyces sp. NPDC052299]|uniref:hypothetical protein n=1 Tax=Streptomyces sp. NPDC052299 TaxID=3155054 RepID=UPI003413832C
MTQSDGEPAFSELLERLWQSKRHPTGRVFTYPEVSQGILDCTGFKITTSGLQQLRTGVNLNPKWYTVKGLAIFFGVETDYFLGVDEPGDDEPGDDESGVDEPGVDESGTDEPGDDVDQDGELTGAEERVLAAMRDRGVLRVALRASGLDEPSLRMVEVVLDQTRRLQGLPEADLSDLLDDE